MKFLTFFAPFFVRIGEIILSKIETWKAERTKEAFARKEYEDYSKDYAEKMSSDALSPQEKEKLFEEKLKVDSAFRNR